MPLIYITGASGSGKSTLAKLLRTRGFTVYDEDNPKIGSAHSLETGQPVAIPSVNERSAVWFAQHEWRILASAKAKLRAQAKNQLVVLVGNSVKPDGQAELFDKVLYLKLDEATLRQRIHTRTDNDYGKSAHELDQLLTRKRAMDQVYNPSNAIIIDADQPLEKVADAVAATIQLP